MGVVISYSSFSLNRKVVGPQAQDNTKQKLFCLKRQYKVVRSSTFLLWDF